MIATSTTFSSSGRGWDDICEGCAGAAWRDRRGSAALCVEPGIREASPMPQGGTGRECGLLRRPGASRLLRARKRLEQRLRLFERDASVGDALPVDRGLARHVVL